RAPGAVIDVSAHRVDQRQRAEPRKYLRAANIPGMDDTIAAGKRRERLRPQQAMGIGNRANGSHHARPVYKRSRVRREPRAMGSATDKLPSKHPAAIPGTGLAMVCAQKGDPPIADEPPLSGPGGMLV